MMLYLNFLLDRDHCTRPSLMDGNEILEQLAPGSVGGKEEVWKRRVSSHRRGQKEVKSTKR